MLRAIQKIVKNGNSFQVTIPRPMLFALGLMPGEFVRITQTGDKSFLIEPFRTGEEVSRLSPGVLVEPAPAVPR